MADNEDPETEPQVVPEGLKEGESVRNLRAAANRSEEHKTRGDKLERELAFVKAGLDTDHPLVASLMATYDGDLSKEAVTKYMTDLRVTELLTPATAPAEQVETPPPADTPALPPQVASRELVAGGQLPTDIPADDPRVVGLNRAFDLMEQGYSRADASTAFFGEVFDAAMRGDARVLTVNQGGQRIEL